MKHLLQNLASGKTEIIDAPDPMIAKGAIIVQSSLSLVSAGTERMLVDFGKASLLEKARQQPEKVRMVLDKVQSDGLLPTIEAVRSKLDQPISLGYSNVGVISELGENVTGFKKGDRVVSNGPHSSIVKTTSNLCALIPGSVNDECASFTVVSSIALQGIRLANPTLGESFVVIGTGLIGLLTVQLLKAQGCRVLAMDIDDEKLTLAKQFGAEVCSAGSGADSVAFGMEFSGGDGVDGVIVTASTKSNAPITQAARMSRKRGRIVLVGVTGLELNRADFYEKELTFQVSCSYGPGRYDPDYEEKGQDYPIGYVRWTEKRNFEAVLSLMAEGKLNVEPLISARFKFEEAVDAYNELSANKSVLGILLEYENADEAVETKCLRLESEKSSGSQGLVTACIGAGNYATRVLIPAFQRAGANLHTIVTAGGVGGVVSGQKAGFEFASSDMANVLDNNEVDAVAIATRHDSHAELTISALNASKHVFVEKPLCLTLTELEAIETAYTNSNRILMIGFNRRFSPLVQRTKGLLENSLGPIAMSMTVNAGEIASEHWIQDTEVGGGRLIGEVCHFIDLMRFLADSPIALAEVVSMDSSTRDTMSISLKFSNGSIGTIHYYANGSSKVPKERLEIYSEGRVLHLDNYKELRAYDWPGFKRMKSRAQDKGQDRCVAEFVQSALAGGISPIPIDQILEVSRVSIELSNSR